MVKTVAEWTVGLVSIPVGIGLALVAVVSLAKLAIVLAVCAAVTLVFCLPSALLLGVYLLGERVAKRRTAG